MSGNNEALLYEPLDNSAVRCNLCAHRCVIAEGKRGICGIRENRGGKLYSLVKNKLVAQSVDPIEKKPLYHFFPGTKSLSIATLGCNFKCKFCQNHAISHVEDKVVSGEDAPSGDVLEAAVKSGAKSISYTYTEPTIFFETAMEIGGIARERGLKNIFVTNGYLTKEAAALAKNFLDAANVDLKSFSDDFYKEICGARLKGVLEGIDHLLDIGIWVEITTLIIPGFNDSAEELRAIARFISERSKDIPWHVSRFHPDYKMKDIPPTPLESMKLAEKMAEEEGIRYTYLGNVYGKSGNTFCRKCGKMVIERSGFSVLKNVLKDGCCPYCGNKIPGCF